MGKSDVIEKTNQALTRMKLIANHIHLSNKPDLIDGLVELAIDINNRGLIDLQAVGFKKFDDVDFTRHLNVHKQLKRFFNG